MPIVGAQMSLDEALHAKDLGQRIVRATNAGFVELMREKARGIAQRRGEVTVDDLREYAAAQGIEPSSPNAWGCLFIGPEWVMVGRRRSRLVSNRGREVKVWVWRGVSVNR